MYLKAIELQGFKSFPDKTVLQFGKGITAVVGPNGSGKSNLSDAMRWVLGEQSTKTLRGSKMEDVIFSGTDSRRAVGFAEVSLVLDNSDAALANPEKEVRVTRRYFRSGESEYKINGKDARLKDIHELFMDTGLGRDGYSMVSQGKIETLVSAKSGERRDMLEEAAG
ncbi:MAG: AAA family ATPase, partial [Clostridia bacterium]|nr:AAA family ATPase [Clostridia bacterium]